MIDFVLKNYFRLYDFVSHERRQAKDLDERHIHTHLVIVLSTGILMWGYTFVALFTISNPIPTYVGFFASAVHLFSPLLFKINRREFLNANILIGSGLLHQSTFAFYSGGFTSNIIIWFGILPMLGGVISGRKGALLWATVTTIVTAVYLALYLNGYHFPNLITHSGYLISQAMLSFGWIFLSAIIIWVYVLLVENNEKVLEDKNFNIQNLVHILSHDISNPLLVVKGRIEILLRKKDLPEDVKISLGKALNGAKNIGEIAESVRQMYAIELGKMTFDMQKVCVYELWSHLKNSFEDKLNEKSLILTYSGPESGELYVWANESGLKHQVMSNLMSNAIKFSHQGSKIDLDVTPVGNKLVKISLKDHGEGIPCEIKDNIFNFKVKTTRVGTSGEKGTGFGMPIVKTYVESIGAKISVESKTKDQGEDHGTSFTIEIPRAD